MNCKFLTLNLDNVGTDSIEVPEDCTDYASCATYGEFLGKNKKILLRVVSKFNGHAADTVRLKFNEFKHFSELEKGQY